jgi:hypothetical protein
VAHQLQPQLLAAAFKFLLGPDKAEAVITHQIQIIKQHVHSVCNDAGLSAIERRFI